MEMRSVMPLSLPVQCSTGQVSVSRAVGVMLSSSLWERGLIPIMFAAVLLVCLRYSVQLSQHDSNKYKLRNSS
jgi:hypothetical protein